MSRMFLILCECPVISAFSLWWSKILNRKLQKFDEIRTKYGISWNPSMIKYNEEMTAHDFQIQWFWHKFAKCWWNFNKYVMVCIENAIESFDNEVKAASTLYPKFSVGQTRLRVMSFYSTSSSCHIIIFDISDKTDRTRAIICLWASGGGAARNPALWFFH